MEDGNSTITEASNDATPPATIETTESGWRVKLYELESSGSWIDRGVGHVRVDLLPAVHPQAAHSHVPSLCIISEDNGSYLLQSKIQSDDLYEKQGETMILWKEADCSTTIDYAMSFQQPEGCAEIWSEINKVQGEYAQEREYGFVPSFSRTQRIGSLNDSDSSSLYTLMDDSDGAQSNMYVILPTDLNDENILPAIKQKLETLHPSQRDYVSSQLLSDESAYFKKLFVIFDELEKAEKLSALQLMAEIFRSIFLLNDPNIIEFLLMDDNVFKSVAGIFEYDRTLKVRGQYRHFLFNLARMTFVVSLANEIQITCKFLYRLKYVRDIMLHPTIDDPGVSAINSMITFTSVDICSQVMNEKAYMAELFHVISPKFAHPALPQNAATIQPSRKAIHAVLFLRELFMLSKFLQLDRRFDLFRTFFDEFGRLFGEVLVYLLSGISLALRTNPKGTSHNSTENSEYEEFRRRFSYEEALSASVAVSEILSTISFVYPSAIRQIILDFASHPSIPAVKSGSGSIPSIQNTEGSHWSKRSLLYLIIDLIVNNVESSSIDFLGETMKNLLDFDKFNSTSALLSSANNNSTGGNIFAARSAVGGNSNANGSGSPTSPTSGLGGLWGSNNKHEKDNFLRDFYEYYLYWLLVPFIDIQVYPSQPVPTSFYEVRGIDFNVACDTDQVVETEEEKDIPFVPQSSLALNTSRRIILDILMVCLSCHSYRIKYFLLHGNYLATIIHKCFPDNTNGNQPQVQRKVMQQQQPLPTQYHPQRTLQLYAVKVLKSVLQAKDEFYVKYIIKQDIFKSLFHSFKFICHRDNIITSAVHDLIEYIRNENHMSLICYLVEKYQDICFDKVQHVEVFDKLRIRYEQLVDRHRDNENGSYATHGESAQSYYSLSMSSESYRSNSGDGTGAAAADAEMVRASARGVKRQYHSSYINNENRKLKELEDDENYLNQDDDDDEMMVQSSPSYHHQYNDEDDSSTGSSFKRQRSIPSIPYTKPRSPPHYNRKHGTDLDGEPSLNSGSSSHSNSPASPIGDAMSIISQYDDDDNDGLNETANCEIDRNLSSSSLSTVIDSIYDEDDLAITRTSSEGDPLTVSELDATASSTSIASEVKLETTVNSTVARAEEEDIFLPPIRSKEEEEEVDEESFLAGSNRKVGNGVSASTNFSALFKKKTQPQIKFSFDQKLS